MNASIYITRTRAGAVACLAGSYLLIGGGCGSNSSGNQDNSEMDADPSGGSSSSNLPSDGGSELSNGGASNGGSGQTSGGQTSGGQNGQSGADAGSEGQEGIGVLGQACSPTGTLACAGSYQKLTLICDADGTWQANETCGATQFCDSTPGVGQGICAEQVAGCEDGPGTKFCADGTTLKTCGPDTVTITDEESCTGCFDGVCSDDVDACPVEQDYAQVVSCAEDCGISGCVRNESDQSLQPEESLFTFPAVVRTPVPSDARDCDGAWALYLEVGGAGTKKLTVAPPWGFGLGCSANVNTTQCLIVGSRALLVVTKNPAASPRNVVIEEVPEGTTCP